MYLSTGWVITLGTAFVAVAMVSGLLGGYIGYEQAGFVCDRLTSVDRGFVRLGQLVAAVVVLAIVGGILYLVCKDRRWG